MQVIHEIFFKRQNGPAGSFPVNHNFFHNAAIALLPSLYFSNFK